MKLNTEPFKKCKFCHELMSLPRGKDEAEILQLYEVKEYCSMMHWNKHQAIITRMSLPDRHCDCGKEIGWFRKSGKHLKPHEWLKITTCGEVACIVKARLKNRPVKPRIKTRKNQRVTAFYQKPDCVEQFYLYGSCTT